MVSGNQPRVRPIVASGSGSLRLSKPPLVMPRRSATCLTPRYSVAIVAVLAVDDSGRETHDSGRETEAARYYRLLDSAPTKATAPNTTATIPKISDVLMMRSPMG